MFAQESDLDSCSIPELSTIVTEEEHEVENHVSKEEEKQGLLITAGIYKGLMAFPTGKETAQMITVHLRELNGKEVRIMKTSLEQKVSSNATRVIPATISSYQAQQPSVPTSIVDEAAPTILQRTITGGTHKGRTCFFERQTEKMVVIHLNAPDGPITRISKSNWDKETELEENSLCFPNRDCPGIVISGRVLEGIIMSSNSYSRPSLFDHFAREQKLTKVVPLSRQLSLDGPPTPIAREFNLEGRSFSLIGSKLSEVKDRLNRSTELRLIYIATSGPGMETFCLEKKLDRLANFAALTPLKAKARLDLLHSPSSKLFTSHLKSSQFEFIRENGNVGCGFIPEKLLENSFGNNIVAKRMLAIQVRIVAPKLGVFKGMLFRKRNISCIQLPSSMQKVERVEQSAVPDLTDEELNSAYMIVVSAGQHPSTVNRYIARYLNSEKCNPPPKSFEKEIKKLSDMIQRLWQGLGVPKSLCQSYARNARSRENLKHGWVVGVADPTNAMPEGHIFVTGMGTEHAAHSMLFVSRSPCVERSDGRLLPVIMSKPKTMSSDDWDWLCGLHFGAIVFANPRSHKTKPIPETIADGDLDGDLYFVCWDSSILASIAGNHRNSNEPMMMHHEDQNSGDEEEKCSYVVVDENYGLSTNDEEQIVETCTSTPTFYFTMQQHTALPDAIVTTSSQIINNSSSSTTYTNSNSQVLHIKGWLSRAQDVMIDVNHIQDLNKLIGKLYCLHVESLGNEMIIDDDDAISFGRAYKKALELGKYGGSVQLPIHLHKRLPKYLHKYLTT